MSYDYKKGMQRLVEFDRAIRDDMWREIQFGLQVGNHEERKQRYLEPKRDPLIDDSLPIQAPYFQTHYGRPRCVLESQPQPPSCPACDAGVPAVPKTESTFDSIMDNIKALMAAMELGSYDSAPSALVQGKALVIEDLDISRFMDPKNWTTFENVPIKLKPSAEWPMRHRVYEGPIDQLKNPCSEVALTKPEEVVLTIQGAATDHGYVIHRTMLDGSVVTKTIPPKKRTIKDHLGNEVPDSYGGSACLEGHIGAQLDEDGEDMFPELATPRFNLADYPHTCGCGSACYNSGFRVECTSPKCKFYKEPK
jgi:hypothetical protein